VKQGVTANRPESKYDKYVVGDISEIDASPWSVDIFGVQSRMAEHEITKWNVNTACRYSMIGGNSSSSF
jgi:hypothetical protein